MAKGGAELHVDERTTLVLQTGQWGGGMIAALAISGNPITIHAKGWEIQIEPGTANFFENQRFEML